MGIWVAARGEQKDGAVRLYLSFAPFGVQEAFAPERMEDVSSVGAGVEYRRSPGIVNDSSQFRTVRQGHRARKHGKRKCRKPPPHEPPPHVTAAAKD